MIKVSIVDNSITASGHASTLICNSVSVLMWALATSLADAVTFEDEDDGFQTVRYNPTEKTKPIFDGFAECFRQMGEQFPKEIKVFS